MDSIGVVKIAEDRDFELLKTLIDQHTGWKIDYDKSEIKVWTKTCDSGSNFKLIKMHALFRDVPASVLYDVLHDPEYRKLWDTHMHESFDIGYLNPNNDVGYYAMTCPPPLKNRDFVLQRSWLDTGDEMLMFNHSVAHKDYPPKKGYVRATSLITGFIVRPKDDGCFFGYITQTDPRGKLPPWLVNKLTQTFGPKLVKTIHKAALGYIEWKQQQSNPRLMPWRYPEQMQVPRISIADVGEHFKQIIGNQNSSKDGSRSKWYRSILNTKLNPR